MTDALLTSNDREEALSRAYARTVSAVAGYDVTETDFDRDGIDLEIKAGGRIPQASILDRRALEALMEKSRAGVPL